MSSTVNDGRLGCRIGGRGGDAEDVEGEEEEEDREWEFCDGGSLEREMNPNKKIRRKSRKILCQSSALRPLPPQLKGGIHKCGVVR